MDVSGREKEFLKNLKDYAECFDTNLKCTDVFLEHFINLFPKYHKLMHQQNELKRKRTFIKYYAAAIEDEKTQKMAMDTLRLALIKTGQIHIEEKLYRPRGLSPEKYVGIITCEECEQVEFDSTKALAEYSRREVYRMTGGKRGICLIINTLNFTNDEGKVEAEATRLGSKKDVKKLKDVFKELHFNVTTEEDLEDSKVEEKMVQALSHTATESYGMFVMVIMSHGNRRGALYDTCSRIFNWNDICRNMYEFHALKGKPKMLMVQACAGYHSSPVEHVLYDTIPPSPSPVITTVSRELIDDTLILTSSFEGYSSLRFADSGSPFVSAVVKTLKKHAGNYHLEEICKMVQDEIREANKKCAEWIKKQPQETLSVSIPVPCYLSFLPKKIYLLPGFPDVGHLPKEADDSRKSSPDFLQSDMELTLCDKDLPYPINRDDVYSMTDRYRGRCLIINIEEFKDGKKRLGSECDAENLRYIFGKLGFYVTLKTNLTGKDIKKELSAVLDEHQYGMFVLIILSRGEIGGNIFGCDGKTVDQHKLRLEVCYCEKLKNKPKLFITDVPAAGEYKNIVPETRMLYDCFPRPVMEDVLILSSWVTDSLPDDNLKYQNPFIEALIYTLKNYSHKWHLEEICKKVQDEMRRYLKWEKNNAVQLPCYVYLLRKMLYLFPGLKTEELSEVNLESEMATPQEN